MPVNFLRKLGNTFRIPTPQLLLPPVTTCQLLMDDIAFALLLLLLLLLFVRSAAAAVAAALQAFNEQTERTQNYKEATSVCVPLPLSHSLSHSHSIFLFPFHTLPLSVCLSDWSARIYTSLQAACKHQLE